MRPNGPADFWKKVNTSGECWLWGGLILNNGYGQFYVDSRQVLAHRYAYEDRVGPIPEGLVIDHLCRTPSCVRPDHLEAVTQQENVLRGRGLTARFARATHCVNGHEFTAENTLQRKGGRACRTCKNRRQREYTERKKENHHA